MASSTAALAPPGVGPSVFPASGRASEDGLLKESWEEYDEAEIGALAQRGYTEVTLLDGEVRNVRTSVFDACEGTPLHTILFDRRWGGVPGALSCKATVFDDICLYLRQGLLPPEHPRSRRKELREAAGFYCLDELAEALDDEAALVKAKARAAKREAEAARRARERDCEELRKQRLRSQHANRTRPEDRATMVVDRVDCIAMRFHSKAHNVSNMAKTVQNACRADAHGALRQSCNRQTNFPGAPNMPKGERRRY